MEKDTKLLLFTLISFPFWNQEIEPREGIRMWMILKREVQLINHLLGDDILTTPTSNDHVANLTLNIASGEENISAQQTFFTIVLGCEKCLLEHKCKIFVLLHIT